VAEAATLLAGLSVLPFFFECCQIAIRSALLDHVGFLFSTAALCGQDFAAGRLRGRACHKPLPLPQKFRALTKFLTNFAASVSKGVRMREQFRKGNLR
jgi:hypothetical protein